MIVLPNIIFDIQITTPNNNVYLITNIPLNDEQISNMLSNSNAGFTINNVPNGEIITLYTINDSSMYLANNFLIYTKKSITSTSMSNKRRRRLFLKKIGVKL